MEIAIRSATYVVTVLVVMAKYFMYLTRGITLAQVRPLLIIITITVVATIHLVFITRAIRTTTHIMRRCTEAATPHSTIRRLITATEAITHRSLDEGTTPHIATRAEAVTKVIIHPLT